MNPNPLKSLNSSPSKGNFLLFTGALMLILMVLFRSSFSPSMVVFANDCPLGLLNAHADTPLDAFTGNWQDLNWIGAPQPTAQPSITQALFILLGPVLWGSNGPVVFAKYYAPASLLIMGICAWILFRRLKFRPAVCLIGALAAALNSNAFSLVCWGLSSFTLAHAAVCLALAAVVSLDGRHTIIKLAIGGTATAVAVMEAYDTGAILSLYVGIFVIYFIWCQSGQRTIGLLKGISHAALLAIVAIVVAAQALATLIGTQIKGVVGTQQDQLTKAQRWNPATQWSLPKIEVTRVLIPGLFGYRMDTPDGGAYWGSVGQTPGWNEHHQGAVRNSGSGEYAGVLVMLLAVYGVAQSFRKKGNPYSTLEINIIRFWGGAAILSLLLAFGRHAPLYQFIYQLPFFSTIRNPIKFMIPFHIGIGILFGFGLEALARACMTRTATQCKPWREQLKTWWAGAASFEKKWFFGLGAWIVISILGVLLFASGRMGIINHLQTTGAKTEMAEATYKFSIGELGWYLAFLIVSALVMAIIASGVWAGKRSRWAWISLGVLLVGDLAHANLPWIVYWEYPYKYASNPVIDQLRQKPYEHRVKMTPFQINDTLSLLQNVYGIEWSQQLFPYYKIQSVDIVQERSVAIDNDKYRAAFMKSNAPPSLIAREWELTNTRYLLGLSGEFIQLLNQQLDPFKNRFAIHTAFDLKPKEYAPPQIQLVDLTASANPNGKYALIDFKGALPRAKLYSHWQVSTNDEATLDQLTNMAFDPQNTVLVSEMVPAPSLVTNTPSTGVVEFVDYKPKYIKLNAQAATPSILLLNDKYDPQWRVWVDGQPQSLLRCNYIMRGVSVPPGQHTIEFRYQPPTTALYVSLGGIIVTLLLGIVLVISRDKETSDVDPPKK